MEGSEFNWKKSRAQQRRKDKRRKDFPQRNRNVQDQRNQEINSSDNTEEIKDVTTAENHVPKDKIDVKSGLNDKDSPSKEEKDSEEKPLVDFSNLKRETEEIEKLKRKNQYEITSNWGRYEVSEKNESLVYDSEEPADILRLLQTPSSHGGHFLLREEQDWTDASKTLLSSCFTLDLRRLSQALSCIPFHVRHELPETIFSAEEMEQMTYALATRRDHYFRSIKEEGANDKNKKVTEDAKNILSILKGDSDKETEIPCLDDSIIRVDKNNRNSTNEEGYCDNDNVVNINDTFSLETCVESTVTITRVEKSPVKEDISFKDEYKRNDTTNPVINRNLSYEKEVKYVENPLPVRVAASESRDSRNNTIKERRTPEKVIYNDRSPVNERKEPAQLSESVFSTSVTDNERDSGVPSEKQFVKESKDKIVSSKSVPISSSTGKNTKEGNTLEKTTQKRDGSANDDFDFFVSLKDPVKKQSSVNTHEKSPSGVSGMTAPKVTAATNKIEKDESLEDWLDSVLNG